MAINTLAVSQQQQYQHTQSSGRTLSRLSTTDLATLEAAPSELATELRENIAIQALAITGELPQAPPPANKQATYSRPLNPYLESVKLILKAYFGEDLEKYLVDFPFELDPGHSFPSGQAIANANSGADFVMLDNQMFEVGERLQVEEWFTRKQSLSYQMQGEFQLDNEHLSLSYEFNISSESTRYSSFLARAGDLQDPLLVQFGSQSLGHIKDRQAFDINNDNSLDQLPVFSGDVGYLVFDENANGRADNGSELFGPTSGNGFGELAAFDTNQNGFIDKEDDNFEQLYLWQPSADGESEHTSLLSLEDAGIMAINLSAIDTPYAFYDENDQLEAQMRQSSFAIGENGQGYGVHQVDVRI